METKNRRPYIRWAVGVSNWRVIVTRTRESHPRLNLRLDGTLASPSPGCRVRLRTAPDAASHQTLLLEDVNGSLLSTFL
jgi:hypothetical protein